MTDVTMKPSPEELLARAVKLARYVVRHADAGHDLSNPKMAKDLGTLERNVDAVLDTIRVPATDSERIAFVVRELVRQRATHRELKELLVSIATEIRDAAAEVDTSATAAADRAIAAILAALAPVQADLATALARIEVLVAAAPTAEDTAALEAALASVRSADEKVDAIAAEATEEPTPEPEPEPTPEPTEEV